MADRDRSEFLPADPVAFIDDQLTALENTPIRPAFNVRSATLSPIERAAAICREHHAILELNAHCRQDEMCAAGAGESLLRDGDRLARQVETAASTGAAVSVKVRSEVPGVSLPTLAGRLEGAGADAIHLDAMDTESVVAEVADATDCFLVVNNGVRDRATAAEYFEYGADAVSVGRASDDANVLRAVRETADEWTPREVHG
jgi:TIM-barrel protein